MRATSSALASRAGTDGAAVVNQTIARGSAQVYSVTTNDKDLMIETGVNGAVVVTARTRVGWETRVLGGGNLDGWTQAADTLERARYNHRWVVRLVAESETLSGLRRRREAEVN